MNKVILMGRLTRDPEVRYSQGERAMAIARYTLAVDRRGRRGGNDDGAQTADFIPCVAFDRAGEFAERYFRQGISYAHGSYKEFFTRPISATLLLVSVFCVVWPFLSDYLKKKKAA